MPDIPEKAKPELIKRLIDDSIRKKEFIFLSDLFSIVKGIKAKKGQKKKLLKPCRIFTGLEKRPIV